VTLAASREEISSDDSLEQIYSVNNIQTSTAYKSALHKTMI